METLMVGMVVLGWLQLLSVKSGRWSVIASGLWALATTGLMAIAAFDTTMPGDTVSYIITIWPLMFVTLWAGWTIGAMLRPILRFFRWIAAL